MAVLGVLLYHVGIDHFSGGYVGVDVFFVISGFLITRLIVSEVESESSFRFGRFYMRRVRRLFPALITTTAFSFVLALLILSPEQMTAFSGSALMATVSISNFWFWWEADYFDALALTKPLLHTWSLSVEEQYYLIWPAAVVFIYGRWSGKSLMLVLAALCVLSLLLSEFLLIKDAAAAFYLLPPRVFELGIGALMVWITRQSTSHPLLKNLIALSGISLILWAMLKFTDDTPFPGLAALIPCLGTAMVIYATDSQLARLTLGNPVAVWIGRISYSLYLVHWPLLVFFFAYTYSEPELWQRWVILLVSIFLGWMQYRYVERRFRYLKPQRAGNAVFFKGAAACAMTLIAVASYAYVSHGVPERIPENRNSLTDKEWRDRQNNEYCHSFEPGRNQDLFTCQNFRGNGRQIFLWGDSHALHLAPGFSEAYPEHDVFTIYMSGCVPQSGFAGYVREYPDDRARDCVERNRQAFTYFENSETTNIVLTSAKRSSPATIADATNEIVRPLNDLGHNIVVLGDFIRPGVPLRDCTTVPNILFSDDQITTRCRGIEKIVERELRYNRLFLEKYPTAIMPDDIQCPNDECYFFASGQLLYRDHHHLNVIGSAYLVEKLRPRIPF